MENNKAERVRTYWYVINELFTVPYLPNPRYEKEHFIKIYADETNNNKYKLLKLPEDKIIKYYNESIKWMKTIQSEAKSWKMLQRNF